jgi:hypothetical protein
MKAKLLSKIPSKKRVKAIWDLNVWCPDSHNWVEDPDLSKWQINTRLYNHPSERRPDAKYELVLKPYEAHSLGLVNWAERAYGIKSPEIDYEKETLDGWLDFGLDCWIFWDEFADKYKDRMPPRVQKFIESLPEYLDEVPQHLLDLPKEEEN